jgi:hypothetical protein
MKRVIGLLGICLPHWSRVVGKFFQRVGSFGKECFFLARGHSDIPEYCAFSIANQNIMVSLIVICPEGIWANESIIWNGRKAIWAAVAQW